MKQPFFFSLCFVSCTGLGWAAGPDFDYTPLGRVLGRFVSERWLVDYPALKAQSDDLNAFVRQLATVSPESHPERFPARADRLAYWINAYNAFVLKSAVDAYPVESVRKIKWFYGFFNRIDHRVGGKPYTLKHIEHHILRTQFDDPRLHAAINCASMGCPRLPQKAFQARSLEEDLESAMQFFLREERNVRIDVAEKRIYLSQILKEYSADFTGWYSRKFGSQQMTILDYLNLFLVQGDRDYLEQHPKIQIRYIPYDWRLNAQRSP